MLGRLGHTVKVVENGDEAVNEVQQRQYDLILMVSRLNDVIVLQKAAIPFPIDSFWFCV